LRLENIKLSDHLEYFISAVQGVAAFDEPLEKILEALYENIKQLLPANSALAATPMQAIAEAKPTHDNAKQLEEANQAYKNKNYQKAFVLYSLLAEQGHTDAQFSLGRMYDHGEGVSHDTGQAVQWYRKAAEQGNAKAQFNLGVMYANGEGVNKDKVKTFQWYRKAAEQGYTNAQFNLGWMYEKGDGVSQAKEQAIYWYKKAAEQGDTDAQNRLTYLSKQP
jgi:TPR repeat protein